MTAATTHSDPLAWRGETLLPYIAFAAGLLLLCAFLVGSRPQAPAIEVERAHPGEPLLWQVDLFDQSGRSLLQAELLGEVGRPLVTRMGSSDAAPASMVLGLDALAAADGLDLKLRLSAPGVAEQAQTRIRLPMGVPGALALRSASGEALTLAFCAYGASSETFSHYLRSVRPQHLRLRPEA